MTELLTYLNSVFIALFLVAGGWVKIRDYFKSRAQKKADAIEAEVQARLKAAQESQAAA